ncbi:MAG: phosphodiester glycosidase family protein, partial [Clostridia bacterium]|nr:phosphodiester glycosidase family protein [Clostridia bacterium]
MEEKNNRQFDAEKDWDDLSFTKIYGEQFKAAQEAGTIPAPAGWPSEEETGQPAERTSISGQLPDKGSFGAPKSGGKPARPYEQDILELQQARDDVLTGRSARRETERKKQRRGLGVRRFLLVLFTTLLAVVAALLIIILGIVRGPSPSARSTFVTTVLESGNLKFLASLFLSADEINEIVAQNSMQQMDVQVNEDLIETGEETEGNFDENGIELVSIAGRSFTATLMIVADPSKVFVGTTYPWGEYGKELGELTNMHGAIGGVNGGLYAADMNRGGRPYGVCVSNGEVLLSDPSGWAGLYMIGLDEKNILRIESIAGWTSAQFKSYVAEQGIRDAVAFQDEASDSNNHFVPLVINGEPRQLNGAGSGANTPNVIGPRAVGAILLLVMDGWGSAGPIGATAQDLLNLML